MIFAFLIANKKMSKIQKHHRDVSYGVKLILSYSLLKAFDNGIIFFDERLYLQPLLCGMSSIKLHILDILAKLT